MLLSTFLLKRNEILHLRCDQHLKKDYDGKGMKSKRDSQGLCRNAKNIVDDIKNFDHAANIVLGQCDQQPHAQPFLSLGHNFFIARVLLVSI